MTRELVASRPPGAANSAEGDNPAGFASLLRQTQAAPKPAPQPGPAAPASSPHQGAAAAPESARPPAHEQGPDADPMDNAVDATPAPAPQGRPGHSAPGKPLPAAPTGIAQREAKSSPRVATDATIDGAKDATTDRDTPAASKAGLEPLPPVPVPPVPDALPGPTPTPWLAALPQTQHGTAPGDAGGQPALADNASSQDAGGPLRAATGPGAACKTNAASMERGPDQAAADQAPADAATNGAAQAVTEQRRVEKEPAPAVSTRSADTALGASVGASFVLHPDASVSPAPALAVALATPVTAPAFAQELGLRMSVLARDGVQHAELHLNPADMGPVSVQIVIDGSQAQVDFGADVAATRAAIEAGLPALAGALRDAGFTLTGGGVSQHSRSRSDGNDGGTGTPRARRLGGSAIDAATGAARHANRRTVTLGGLDLYA